MLCEQNESVPHLFLVGDVDSIQVLQIDDVTIKISALKAIFDQLMTFGFEPFKTKKIKATQKEGAEVNSNEEQESKESEEETAIAKNVLKLLSDFLDSEVRNNHGPVSVQGHFQHVYVYVLFSFLS